MKRHQTLRKITSFLILSLLIGVMLQGGKSAMAEETKTRENQQFELSFGNPQDAQYFFKNPGRVNNIGDPMVYRDPETGTFWMTCTSDSIGYFAWPSEDLVNFGSRQRIYQRPDDAWSTDSYWAPEVYERDGTFYLFYSARQKDTERLLISVATSEKPEGPFTDASPGPVFDFGYAAIDATVFVDPDTEDAYLYFAKDCSENVFGEQHKSEIYGAKLSPDWLSVEDEPVLLLTPDQAWENPHGEWAWNEGPAMLKHNGRYYLSYSANMFEDPAYAVGYAVSDEPLGSFTKAETNPILSALGIPDVSGSGHHQFIESPDGEELWATYHTHTLPQKPSGHRQYNLDRAVFLGDELQINGPTEAWQGMPGNKDVRVLSQADVSTVHPELFDGLTLFSRDQEPRGVQLQGSQNFETEIHEPRKLAGLCVSWDRPLREGEKLSVTVGIGDEEATYTYDYQGALSLPLAFPERVTDRVSLTLEGPDDLLITETQWIEKR